MVVERRALRPDDVAIDVLYCGLCHSDIHMVHGEWGAQAFPMVPGHEFVGRVTEHVARLIAIASPEHP